MWRVLLSRIKQGHRTISYPAEVPPMPDRFVGRPVIDQGSCANAAQGLEAMQRCEACAEVCPTDAVNMNVKADPSVPGVAIDLGRCLFCTECVDACPEGAIRFSRDHRLAVRRREDLVVDSETMTRASALEAQILRLFRRSLKLREVSAGGCNACEADTNVLTTIGFDLGRFGIQFVASPRHADGLLITGPVTENMKLALLKTYEAVAAPKIVIAVGACAISGGPYLGHEEQVGGAGSVLPVDLFIPGCPPHPLTILDGLLALLDRLDAGNRIPATAKPDLRPSERRTGASIDE